MKLSSVCLVIVIAALTVASGCQPAEQITTQRSPKSESGYLANRNPAQLNNPGGLSPAPPLTPDRMLVAAYPLDSAMWFFKLNGTIEQIQSVEPEVIKFFESIEFADGSPKWELPPKWIKGQARPMRFATLRIGESKPPLEMAISDLPAPQDLLFNINRWRGQMSLPPIKQEELDSSKKPLKSKIDKSWLFDVNGRYQGSMMGQGMRPPMQGNFDQPAAISEPAPPQAKMPEGWEPGPTSAIVPLRFQKQIGSGTAQISVSRLPAAVNEWDPNVALWAEQVELQELTADQLKERTRAVEIDGVSGSLIRLIPDDESKAKGTIGVMVKHNEWAWFIKLTGDRKIVAENEETFIEFLKTIKLPSEK